MSRVRAKDTDPEMKVRKALHAAGLRYRLHPKGVMGKPDLFFVKQKAAIFVHGCFWHRHGCHLSKDPNTRSDFWLPKLSRNQERDAKVKQELVRQGYRHLAIWECSVRGNGRLQPGELAAWVRRWLVSSTECGEIRGR